MMQRVRLGQRDRGHAARCAGLSVYGAGCDIPPKAARGQERFAALAKSEVARWTPIIKAANIKAE